MSYPLQDQFPHAIVPRTGLDTNVANNTPALWAFAPYELLFSTDSQQFYVAPGPSSLAMPVGGPRLVLSPVTANTTAIVPPGYVIDDVFIQETAGNAVTGGIKIGTTSGGTQIATSITVNANSFTRTLPGSLNTSGPFSASASQTIFIQAVTNWNGANLIIVIPLKRAIV